MNAGAKRVELKIPAQADFIVVARLATAAIANRLGFGVEVIEELKLAVAEACTTCIGRDLPDECISIVWEAREHMLDVSVGDQRSEHEGLGLTIIRQLMDRVSYVRTDGVTALLMSKRLETQ